MAEGKGKKRERGGDEGMERPREKEREEREEIRRWSSMMNTQPPNSTDVIPPRALVPLSPKPHTPPRSQALISRRPLITRQQAVTGPKRRARKREMSDK